MLMSAICYMRVADDFFDRKMDGVRLTQSEIEQLLRQTEGLAFLKGKWIEVNHEKLKKLLEEMDDIPETLSFRDAVQLEMGNDKILPDVGIVVTNGAWLSKINFSHGSYPAM